MLNIDNTNNIVRKHRIGLVVKNNCKIISELILRDRSKLTHSKSLFIDHEGNITHMAPYESLNGLLLYITDTVILN